MSTLDEYKAALAAKDAVIAVKDARIAILEAALMREWEIAIEREAIKAALAAHETGEPNNDQPSVSQVVISPAMKARIVGTVVRPEFQVDYSADMLQDAGDGAYTV